VTDHYEILKVKYHRKNKNKKTSQTIGVGWVVGSTSWLGVRAACCEDYD
jgi:hypothetical protein